ncbi:PaaI family thioesterase [Qipengyuania sediminis]|uniref:PaaI family thioesterase n=1 Tax=Qipengyuania sediminis TaxID=1532023 RepID=UPI0010594331|nr:PaaI family thioesterase [Qipengyuania sediminis]
MSLVTVTEGEFAGWQVWQSDAFEQRAGPFYEKTDQSGGAVIAFRAEARHMNGAGFMHGGCLMTFADSALFTIARRAMDGAHGVTLNLAGDFLEAVRAGQWVEARGEVTRGGGKTIFIRGLVTADGTPALSFTGIIRKVTRR